MDYFLLDTTGDLNDESICLIEDAPDGMGINSYRMSLGDRAKKYWPEDAKISLRPENPGIKLTGILSNVKNYLLINSKGAEIIKEFCSDMKMEILPFTLINHKKRIHSTDYCCVNLIGNFDCLNEEKSGITYGENNDVISIDEYVLDAKKVKKAPHCFRIDKHRSKYVISRELGRALKDAGITNLFGTLLVQV